MSKKILEELDNVAITKKAVNVFDGIEKSYASHKGAEMTSENVKFHSLMVKTLSVLNTTYGHRLKHFKLSDVGKKVGILKRKYKN